MVTVTISPAGRPLALAKGLPITLEVSKPLDKATVADVKAALAARYPKLYTSRQKLSLKGDKKALADESTLQAAGVTEGGELAVKDLGPQLSWTFVFIIEYIGPLLIHPLFYHFPGILYGKIVEHSQLQRYVYYMCMAHFLKRELETLFVHRFSHGTMPFAYIFRNSAHYHILGGLGLAWSVYSPTYSAHSSYIQGSIRDNSTFLFGCIAVWLWAELSNLTTHIILRNLRPAGTRKRAIPYGYGFNLVSCPNYLFEIIGWIVITIMTGSYASFIFLVAGAYIMTVWAIKKHKNYKKEFGTQYPKRNVIFPYIL